MLKPCRMTRLATATLELFRTPGGWVTQAVEFNAVPEEVFPPGLLEP